MKKLLMIALVLISIRGIAQKVGEVVPEINLNNLNGEPVSLSSLKGKVVLLDFWASWCGPCRAANKELVKVYKKYKAKGLEIYSVSVDGQEAKWRSAVKAQKITWIQVNDPGDWDSPTARNWGIDALPTTFLIDKKGVLRHYNLEGKQLTRTIEKLIAE